MRIIDLQLSFPAILLASCSRPCWEGERSADCRTRHRAICLFRPHAHGAASAERSKEYVEAALSTPLAPARVVFRHILPNACRR